MHEKNSALLSVNQSTGESVKTCLRTFKALSFILNSCYPTCPCYLHAKFVICEVAWVNRMTKSYLLVLKIFPVGRNCPSNLWNASKYFTSRLSRQPTLFPK